MLANVLLVVYIGVVFNEWRDGMDKVKELLTQAWSEAKAQGFSLEAVYFNCEYFYPHGDIKAALKGIDIDAKLTGKKS